MSRVQRNVSPWRFVKRGVAGLPAVLACSRLFRNWQILLGMYVGMRDFVPPFVAVGRGPFTVTHWEPSDLQTTWAVFCTASYEVPRGGGLVLDLGANIGAFSIYAARVLGVERLIALEPVAQTFDKLQANIAANKLGDSVTPIRKGIGGSSGPRTIHLGVSSPHSSMFYRGDPHYESGAMETIEVTTLDQLFEDLDIDHVDMCKLDCEGGEVEALLAASDDTLRCIRHLSMEYHFPANLSDETALFGRLERAGFRCVWHDRGDRLAHLVQEKR
jgi:FkbM family methyltransferase